MVLDALIDVRGNRIATGTGDSGLQVVRDQQLRHATEEVQHALVQADPVGQRLGPGGLGIGVAGGPEHPDKDLGLPYLTGVAIDDGHGRATVVDEGLLAGPVALAHAALLAISPFAAVVTELRVAIGPLTVAGDILGPQQLQRPPPCA